MAIGSAIGAGLGLVSAFVGGKKQNKLAQQGAEAQTEAARIAAGAQRQGFVDATRLQQGRAQAGDAATARMLQLLGLPVPQSLTSGSAYESIYGSGGAGGGQVSTNGLAAAGQSNAQDYLNRYPDVAQAYNNLTPEDRAYIKRSGYAPTAAGFAQYHYDTHGMAAGRQFGGGGNGLAGAGGGQYAINVPGVGGGNGQQSVSDLIRSTPGYQFRMDEGRRAIDSSAASRGMLLSGGALKRLQDFGSEYAAQEFDKYYNRLAGVAGSGQTATGNIAAGSQAAGANLANIQTNLGRGLASSYSQQTSPFGNALATAGGYLSENPINFGFGGGG